MMEGDNDNSQKMEVVVRYPFTPMHWGRHEDIIFERGLVKFPEGTPERWERIAAELPGRTAEEVSQHHVMNMDSGRVKIPSYVEEAWNSEPETRTNQITSQVAIKKKKAASWTPEEHRLFLHGLEKYGKGDWKSISRYAVRTKTAVQVASHAQKFFIRQSSSRNQKRKRSSIHDINISDNFPNNQINTAENLGNNEINIPSKEMNTALASNDVNTSANFPSNTVDNFPNNVPNDQDEINVLGYDQFFGDFCATLLEDWQLE